MAKNKVGTFVVWKKLQVGRIGGLNSVLITLSQHDVVVDDWARRALEKITFSTDERTVSLALLTASDLGFRKPAKYSHIFAAAKRKGLLMCPDEVGALLCLADVNMQKGEIITVAVHNNFDQDRAVLFSLWFNGSTLLLLGMVAHQLVKVEPRTKFVFMLPD